MDQFGYRQCTLELTIARLADCNAEINHAFLKVHSLLNRNYSCFTQTSKIRVS